MTTYWLPDVDERPCACGEPVIVYGGRVQHYVREHQRLPKHRRWRERGGIEAMAQERQRSGQVLEHGYRVA